MKKKKSMIITIVVILVILILTIIGVLLYLTTDLFKSNSELFFEYVAKNTELAEMLKETDKSNNQGKYITKAKVGFDLTSTDVGIANEVLPARNFTIEYNGKTDKENRLASGEATLKYLSTELFTLKYRQTKDTYALKSDEVINRYLAFENNNLKDLAAKYQIEGDFPNKISNENLSNLITKQELENWKNTYLPIIQNNIPKEAFTKKKAEQVSVYNKNLTANQYSLTLSKTQVNNIIKKILETLKQDTITLNSILDKLDRLNIKDSTIEELQEEVQNKINQIEEDTEEIEQYLVIHLYESEKELVKTEIMLQEKKLTIDFDKSQTSKRALITTTGMETQEAYNLESIELVKGSQNGTEQQIVILKLKSEENETMTLSIQNKKEVGNTTNSTSIININANNETYFTISIDKQIEFVEDIQIEKLDHTNSVKFNDFTPDYGLQTLQAVSIRLMQLFNEKSTQLMLTEANQQTEEGNQTPNPSEETNTIEPIQSIEPNNVENSIKENNI